jgi:hypothetical protein
MPLWGTGVGAMTATNYIPPATVREIANPAPEGQRHDQAVKIACSLAGNGHEARQIVSILRAMYPDDVSDAELTDIVNWATGKNFQPSHGSNGSTTSQTSNYSFQHGNGSTTSASANAVAQFIHGLTVNEFDIVANSPVIVPTGDDWTTAAALLVEKLYQSGELINIVVDHAEGKPIGYGLNIERDNFLAGSRNRRQRGSCDRREAVTSKYA